MKLNMLSSLKSSHFVALMGQSNAAGYQATADQTTYLAGEGQYIFDNPTQSWQPLQRNWNNGGTPILYRGYVGMEIKLMQLLRDYYGADQYMFKYSAGNTPIGPKGPTEDYDWVPNTGTNYMFNGCVESFRNAKNNFPAQMPKINVLIWMQGENDTSLERANTYKADFTRFISSIKNSWGLPDLKVLQTLLSNSQTAYDGWGKTVVNTAKIDYSVNGNKYVNIDGADCPDGVHFSAAGQEYIAQKVFSVLRTML